MGELDQPVRRAWRRLRAQRFLDLAVWGVALGVLVGAVLIALDRFQFVGIPGPGGWPALAGVLIGILAAAAVAISSGPDRMEAAMAIDHAFELQERLSTALSLGPDLKQTPAGQAILADAVAHVSRLEITERFALRRPRRLWLTTLPVLLALGLVLMPADWIKRAAAARTGTPVTQATLDPDQAKQQAQALGKKLAEARKKLDSNDFDETQKLLADIESFADKMATTPPASREPALLEINKLSDALKDRQRRLGSNEAIQKQLQQLQDRVTNGPADEFAKAMQQGDFQKATDKLANLRQRIKEGSLTEKEREQMKSQLEKMARDLEKLADLDQKKEALEQARKNGGLSEQQYQEEMSKLQQQAQQMEPLRRMAQQIGQAQQALQQGNMSAAADALGMTTEQLEALAQEAQELQSLDQALTDLMEAKAGMCNSPGNSLGESNLMGNMMGQRLGLNGGMGMGPGQGRGDRPEAPDNVNAYNTRTPQQHTKGAAIVTGSAPPSGVTPGQSLADVQQTIETADAAGVAEAMSNQKVPARVKQHVMGYFEQLRKGN